MRAVIAKAAVGSAVLSLLIIAACADAGDENVEPGPDGGQPDVVPPDAPDASDGGGVDAQALRCSDGFCILDLPSPTAYGFTEWMFAGVHVDPVIGVWAIANGVYTVDQATVQLMHFENGTWRPAAAPALGEGPGKRSIELYSITSEAPGKLIAVGATLDDATPVIVRGDGTSFTTSVFEQGLSAVWSNAKGDTFVAGAAGGIFRSETDGGWIQDTTAATGDFESIWGTDSNDLYVGGVFSGEFGASGYIGHRKVDDAGAPTWSFRTVPEDLFPFGDPVVLAGVVASGASFWAAPTGLVRVTPKANGDDEWAPDPYQPRIPIRSFWAGSTDEIWSVGHVGRVARFDGTAWKNARLVFNDAPLTSHLTGVAGTSAGEIFVVGEGVALRREAK